MVMEKLPSEMVWHIICVKGIVGTQHLAEYWPQFKRYRIRQGWTNWF
jgi:hypothetical protein